MIQNAVVRGLVFALCGMGPTLHGVPPTIQDLAAAKKVFHEAIMAYAVYYEPQIPPTSTRNNEILSFLPDNVLEEFFELMCKHPDLSARGYRFHRESMRVLTPQAKQKIYGKLCSAIKTIRRRRRLKLL